MQGEGERPKTVGVAAGAAVGGEADVAGAGGFFLDGAQVGADVFAVGDFDASFFEGAAERVGEGLF